MNHPSLLTYKENKWVKAFLFFSLWGSAVFWLFQQHHIILLIIGLLWIGLNHLQSQRDNWSTYLTHSVAVLIPISLMWTLYHTALQAWWLADDPALLQNVVEHGIFSHFYQSDVWRSLSYANLTPWVALSLGIDWQLFGLEPLGFYWHHLLSFSIVLIIAYLVLNLFFSPLICSLTLSLFVASVPSANIAQFLMVRHYLEGLGLSLLAIWGYVKAVQTQRHGWAYLGSLFYLLATTAKEIYVPLVVVLPCLPVGNWRQRWKMLIPFVAVAGSYVLWRIYMLKPSQMLTGYGDLSPKLNWDSALPSRVPEVLGWQHSWQLLIMLLAAFVYLFIIFKYLKNIQWIQLCAVLLWLAVTLLPIVPVLSILDSRYLFLPYFVFCLGVAFSLQFLMDKQWHYVALGLGLSVLAVGVKSVESGVIRQVDLLKQYRIEGNLILTDKNANGLLVNPIGADWYYQSLQWLREHVLKLPKGARACYDLCICQPDKVYQYVQGQLRTSHVSEQAQDCGQADAALSLKLHFATNSVHWQLGPYQQGQYYATLSTEKDVITGKWLAVPAQGKHPIELSNRSYLLVKYVSPEGWQTYSPVLELDPAQKNAQGVMQLIWQRH